MTEHMICKRCEVDVLPHFVPGPFGPHEAKLICPECGSLLKWVAKEKNNGKRPRNKYTPEILGIEHCQLCMRPRARLGAYETLAVHHVEEISKGGADDPENIWVVCTPCHALIHHQRTYLNDHTAEVFEQYGTVKRILSEANLKPSEYEIIIQQLTSILGV